MVANNLKEIDTNQLTYRNRLNLFCFLLYLQIIGTIYFCVLVGGYQSLVLTMTYNTHSHSWNYEMAFNKVLEKPNRCSIRVNPRLASLGCDLHMQESVQTIAVIK